MHLILYLVLHLVFAFLHWFLLFLHLVFAFFASGFALHLVFTLSNLMKLNLRFVGVMSHLWKLKAQAQGGLW